MNERIDYVELRSGEHETTKSFYTDAFGWGFVDYGPEYAGFDGAGLDGGLDAAGAEGQAPLVILKSDDLDDALARVEAAGGEITRAPYDFPGGRRFHFRDPAGNELAVWAAPAEGSSNDG